MDALASVVTTVPIKQTVLTTNLFLTYPNRSVNRNVNDIAKRELGWIAKIVKYLETREVPNDTKEAHKVQVQATQYLIINIKVYKKLFGGPYLRYFNEEEAQCLLAEFHEGVYDNNPRGQTLIHSVHSQ